MFIQISIFILGLLMLYFGSDLLLRGSVSTAVIFAVRPFVLGLTIVSFATSAPEMTVSLVAALQGYEGISLGNVIGSNVINLALVLGISAVIKKLTIEDRIVKREIPYMSIISLVFWILCMDSEIGRLDSMVLIFLLAVFIGYGLINAKDSENFKKKYSASEIVRNIFFIIAGIFMLSYGANFIVREAIWIAEQIGLSQTFIGISVVALGTSLPELATSAMAASKNESDICVGNVVGSNLFNICFVIGVVGIFNPMSIDPDLHFFQFPFMVFISLFLCVTGFLKKEVGRISGAVFLSFFIIYIIISYIRSLNGL